MSQSSNSVEVIIEDLKNNPHCVHGPTLLFRRIGKKRKEFYACSACRDHKDCSFYLDSSKKKVQIDWRTVQKQLVADINQEKLYDKYLRIVKNIRKRQAKYCCKCSEISVDEDEHADCGSVKIVTEYQLRHPTELLKPKEDSKNEAQYFFSRNTVAEIVAMLVKMKISRIMCIGAPRIHECVLNELKGDVKSLLLDIDKSYYNFYSKKEFVWYNMFNNHLFDESCQSVITEFLKGKKIAVVMDPPFGGRVEPLAHTLSALNELYLQVNQIQSKGGIKLPVLWFFPYFMEHHIKASLPDFNMLDYKVDYENHVSFTNVGPKKRKFGSPVRIFTNLPLSRFDLEGVSGYNFCQLCGFWVAEENRHCRKCEACTSKNGRTYVHCDACARCVKPTYVHCDTCQRCCLNSHVCGEFQPDPNCFHCHKPGHKKHQCPELLKKEKRKLKGVGREAKMKRS